MIKISSRYTDVPWYREDLDLTTSYPNKANVTKWEAIGATGNAFATNIPTANFNSLGKLTKSSIPGKVKVYRLDAKNIPSGGFDLDNGEPPASGYDPFSLNYTFPNSTKLTLLFSPTILHKKGVLTSTVTGNGSAEYKINEGSYGSLSAANAAISSLPDNIVDTNGYKVQVRLTRPTTTTALSALVTITY